MSVSTLTEPNSSAAATTDTSNSGTLRLVSLCTCTYSIVCTYVLVITCLRGMLLVYGHETRGRVAPEGGVSINSNIPIRHVLIDL